jgi:molybdopterin molybdotransferase
MIQVATAEQIIQSQVSLLPVETVYFEQALGRVLAEDILADRDMPPYNRITMDGIAISFQAYGEGVRAFNIVTTQAAGDTPITRIHPTDCVEIMTGAALPACADTIVRYEDIDINNSMANIKQDAIIKPGQNIHYKGKDKMAGQIVATANQLVTPAVISLAASVGKSALLVRQLPKVVIISSGDELVGVETVPDTFQIRTSNSYTIKAILQQFHLVANIVHIPDDAAITKSQITRCLAKYDVLLLTGGISMGKFDYIPQALEDCGVEKLFHKVQQRPGKPFWFGRHAKGNLVFAFPGNPVSTFMCVHRYFLPWLQACLGINAKPVYAQLNNDYSFTPALQYFLQVRLSISASGQLLADPVTGNGSGDFANLLDTNAFMELPLERDNFTKGELFRVWPFNAILG